MNGQEYARIYGQQQQALPPWSLHAFLVLLTVCVVSSCLYDYLVTSETPTRAKQALRTMASRLSFGVIRRPAQAFAGSSREEGLGTILGLRSAANLKSLGVDTLQRGIGGIRSMVKSGTSEAPAGLGNWDNSCYQNSIVQGLASLHSLPGYLRRITSFTSEVGSMNEALLATVEKLNNADNNGNQIWLPPALKAMSSWQQQDAQEYFSKILDQVDKEAIKSLRQRWKAEEKPGLEGLSISSAHTTKATGQSEELIIPNPLEGMIAQRVACKSCGHSDGISLIPFNCLTVPLGRNQLYDIRDCLDEYTELEEIEGVQCPKCTLLQFITKLRKMIPLATVDSLREVLTRRLEAVVQSLDEDDYSDTAITKHCQIPKKQWVESTKTKQAVIARAPQSLAIHVNRSIFDELTGMQLKNAATVQFPLRFDLGDWILGKISVKTGTVDELENWSMAPQDSMLPTQGLDSAGDDVSNAAMEANYELRAVITHFGRHDSGHYVCYRRHPKPPEPSAVDGDDASKNDVARADPWWRLSDEDVSEVSEDFVLRQGGVFMLFYERIESDPTAEITLQPDTKGVAAPLQEAASQLVSTGAISKDDHEELNRLHKSASRPASIMAAEQLPTPPESVIESDVDDLVEDRPVAMPPAQAIRMRTSSALLDTRTTQDPLRTHRMVTASGMAH